VKTDRRDARALHEGLPSAPAEAMACGLPVVSAAASGIPDIFEGGEESGGIIVESGNVNAFAHGLGRLLDDRQFCWELGQRGRRRAKAFSLEAVGRQLAAVLVPRGQPSAD
jgi:glycosyltransferase involved in cell wall biosynthesis